MRNVMRVVYAGLVLVVWSPLSPARPAHIVPIDQASDTVKAARAETTCPLRAWPYIG